MIHKLRMNGLFGAIRTHALLDKKRVAIGMLDPALGIIESLEEAKQFANIIVVGTPIDGFDSIEEKNERKASDCLIALLQSKRVDAIVRGQIYYTHYHDSMNEYFEFKRDVMCPYLLRDHCRNEWFITPVVHHDDASVDGRCYLSSQTARICEALGNNAVIAVLAPDKKSEMGYSDVVDKGILDAEAIVAKLISDGFNARMVELRIDLAASGANIVVPMDGIVGNFVYRSLGSLGGATLVGGFTLTNRFVSIDTSQSQKGFSHAIESAVAMANLGGMPVDEY